MTYRGGVLLVKNLNLKFISLLAVFSMLLLSLTVTAAAVPGEASLEVGSAVAKSGDSFEVTLTVTENPGMAYAKFLITYDKNALTLDSVQNGQVFDGLTKGAFLVFSNTGNTDKTGALAILHFAVNENAKPKEYPITVTLSEAYNEKEEDVICSISDGILAVIDSSRKISVNITWGNMEFTYKDGTWNSETHKYEGSGWTPYYTDGNKITVENSGNVDVDVSFSFSGVVDPIVAGFSDGEKNIGSSVPLAAGTTKSVWLTLSDKPDSVLDNTKLGTVTVALGGN